METMLLWVVIGDIPPTPSIPGTRIDIPSPTHIAIAGSALALAIFLVGNWLLRRTPPAQTQMPDDSLEGPAVETTSAPQRGGNRLYVWVSVVLAVTLVATITASFMYIEARRNYRSPGPVRQPAPQDSQESPHLSP